MTRVVTEPEFIELWRNHKSAAAVAKACGITERNVHARRRRVEQKLGIKLECEDVRAKQYAHLQTAHQRDGNIFLGIESGTVVVFSDAHFFPGVHTTAFHGLACCGPLVSCNQRPSLPTAIALTERRFQGTRAFSGTKSLRWLQS